MQIKIHSSHVKQGVSAAFIIDSDGKLIKTNADRSFGKFPTRFDVQEFRNYYGKLDAEIDVLDIGYWLPNGKYIEPEWAFRKNALVENVIVDLGIKDPYLALADSIPDVRLGTVDKDRAEYRRLIQLADTARKGVTTTN